MMRKAIILKWKSMIQAIVAKHCNVELGNMQQTFSSVGCDEEADHLVQQCNSATSLSTKALGMMLVARQQQHSGYAR